ncbi:ABC transporter ATP-binding protein [Paenibacillus fonticola]|uniref:ABC transporter ATP-binding protein n=1 Tax=Paenibacillus fonticola TaxID=379896 RepID=UPI00037D0ABF|nr:ABC transporter ATP-binding protein [Paenibacillus fonticola]
MSSVLEVNDVTKQIKGRTIIDGISFSIPKGEVCGFLGPNGSGKTTMIRMLTGLLAPTKGRIAINGIDMKKNRTEAALKMGAIVESPIFFPYMTGRGNLRNLARLHPNLSIQEQRERIEEVLGIVGLTARADDRVGTYSLGMKQRLGVAQAILGNPDFVILDEPANGLDPMGMRDLRNLILSLREKYNMSFLISSHLLDEIQKVCSQLILIKDGRKVWSGRTVELGGGKLGGNEKGNLEDAFVELMTR